MRFKLNCCRAKLSLLFGIFTFDILRAQNIIDVNSEADSSALAANPAKLTETDFSEFIWQFADCEPGADRPEVRRILARLEIQVVELKLARYCAYALWASGGRAWKKSRE